VELFCQQLSISNSQPQWKVLVYRPLTILKSSGSNEGASGSLSYHNGVLQASFSGYLQLYFIQSNLNFHITASSTSLIVGGEFGCSAGDLQATATIALTLDPRGGWSRSSLSLTATVVLGDIAETIKERIRAYKGDCDNALGTAKDNVDGAKRYMDDLAQGVCDPSRDCYFKCPQAFIEQAASIARHRQRLGKSAFSKALSQHRQRRMQRMGSMMILHADVDNWFDDFFDDLAHEIVGSVEWAANNGYAQLISATNTVMSGLCSGATTVCGAGCQGLSATLEAASQTLIVATGVLDASQTVVDTALDLVSSLFDFELNSIGFSLHASVDSAGVGFSVGYTFKGDSHTVSFDLSVDNYLSVAVLVEAIFEKIIDALLNVVKSIV